VAPPTDPRIARAVKPVEEQLKLAANQLELYEKEMAKPEKNRNLPMAAGCRLRAAQFYNLAAMKSKAAEGQFSKAEDKQIIIDQYEKPAREKAIALYLELADMAMQKQDVTTAVGLYKEVLKVDSENADAKQALKNIQETMQPNPADSGPNNTGGGQNTPRPYETWKKDYGAHNPVKSLPKY
jgi:tetratricopeptide (TPR) repeat protein